MNTNQPTNPVIFENNPMYEKLINYIMQRGKKSLAQRILKTSFQIINKRGLGDPEKVFKAAVTNVKPKLEVKAKRIGGAVYQIPREVKPERQLTLALRWIIAAARTKKGKPIAECLADELIDASNEQGNAIKKRDDTHRMAQANKAFAHFAKY